MALLLCAWTASADNVSQQKAAEVASAFFRSAKATGISQMSVPSLEMVYSSKSMPKTAAAESPTFYVFQSSGRGFVIVAGDDAVRPVLGYSLENSFPEDNVPPELLNWFSTMNAEINAIRESGIDASADGWGTSSTLSGEPVVSMNTAKWDQGKPYNMSCPEDAVGPGGHVLAGCGPTAMAIIMRYHQWPEKVNVVLPGYNKESDGTAVAGVDLSSGYTYDWENMPLEFDAPSAGDERMRKVADLIYHCGVAAQADYTANNTNSYATTLAWAFSTYFGYSSTARYEYRSNYSSQQWSQMMRAELDAGRPVLYRGASYFSGGHLYVIDGYTADDYFSVNWGWGGDYNGYFLLSSLNPYEENPGSSDGFYLGQGAVVGIQKDNEEAEQYGESMRYILSYKGEYAYNGLDVLVDVKQNEPFLLFAGLIINAGTEIMNGVKILLAVTDRNGVIVQELYRWEDENGEGFDGVLQGNGWYIYPTVTISEPILPGYRIRGFFKSDKTHEWTLIKGNEDEGCVWDLLIADEYSIEESTRMTYDRQNERIYVTVKEGVSAVLTGPDGADITSAACTVDGTLFTIDKHGLTAGNYVLTLTKGTELKEITIVL